MRKCADQSTLFWREEHGKVDQRMKNEADRKKRKHVRNQRGKSEQLILEFWNKEKKSCSQFSYGQEANADSEAEGWHDKIWNRGRQDEQHGSELPGVVQWGILVNQRAEHYSNLNVTEQKHREGF